jgi:hypothetical protein
MGSATDAGRCGAHAQGCGATPPWVFAPILLLILRRKLHIL